MKWEIFYSAESKEKLIVTDVLEIVQFIIAQRRIKEVGLRFKLFQHQVTLYMQVF